MEIFASTPRLILREIIPADAPGMLALDGDPAVVQYVGGVTINTLEEAREKIRFIRQQYVSNGIGRWAVIEKASNNFVGWAGLKLVTEPVHQQVNFYDVGYRFIPQYWGKGYATECAVASLRYGFEQLQPDYLYAWTDASNTASAHVLTKVGFLLTDTFVHDGVPSNWFEISRLSWQSRIK